uniref:Pentatricopeptide repeat-containing protein n=1 Tax=Kalanchoe fedtschenkoi TaxID=63787 RepID=A0A7N0TB44_KALFE
MELKLNTYVRSVLVHIESKSEDYLMSAWRIFDEMQRRDVVLWNAMITGYEQNGPSDEGISLFCDTRRANCEPSGITLNRALSWDSYVLRKDLQREVYVATALIDMYAKCGSLSEALRIFE